MLPNFLIIGAPRAGTTWLAKNLRQHPEVYMPAEKELHFFNRHYEEGQAYYQQFFENASGFKAIGEATPEYLYKPEVAERLFQLLPDCKLILSLRDPVERVYSRYWNSKAKYAENRELSFEEKLRQKPVFLDEGKYYTHLCRYYRYFSSEQFLVLLYEDIKKDPERVLRTVFKFLEIDPSYVPSIVSERINAAADKPNLAHSHLLYYLQKAAAVAGFASISRYLANKNAADLPDMDPDTRQWLAKDVYAEENRRLRELTGLNLDRWT